MYPWHTNTQQNNHYTLSKALHFYTSTQTARFSKSTINALMVAF